MSFKLKSLYNIAMTVPLNPIKLRRLIDSTNRIIQGDYSVRISPITDNYPLNELTLNVNQIAHMLEKDKDVSRREKITFEGCQGMENTGCSFSELEKQVRLFKEYQEIAQIGHYTFDIISGYWNCSESLDRIFGIKPSYTKDFQGWLQIIHPDQRNEMAEYFNPSVLTSKMPFNREYKITRINDHDERWVHGRGTLEFDQQGTPVKIFGIIQDITQRKQLEEQLFQAQKMESVGRLAGGVAHDFNNMLSVILGYAELMRIQLPSDNPLIPDLLEIEKAANHSKETTKQLLAFSRKQIISPKPLNLNKGVESTINTLSHLIGEDIEIGFFPTEDIWKIEFDPSQLEQILVNLAVNARDAMPNGGKLTIETHNVTLGDTYCAKHIGTQPGNYALLSVSDNGCGMDKNIQSHIFEPFFTTKDQSKGTGLGLSTVYGIVKQNKGYIFVHSDSGRGSSFKIYIPQAFERHKTQQTPQKKKIPCGSETILLVEDDALVRKMTATMLNKLGYTLIVAESPSEALSKCRESKTHIDVLLTDVVMPEMNGKTLRDKIKSIKPDIKVLFMSGYTSNFIAHHGVLEEGVEFIPKPFSLNALAEKVRTVIQTRV